MSFVKRAHIAFALIFPGFCLADVDVSWGVSAQHQFRLTPDIVYLTANAHQSKLDVIAPTDKSSVRPVLLYIHGGGWVAGDKNRMFLHFLPYLQMGMAVVNVGYRLGPVASAPAAVEDARCALRWVYRNADAYGLDTARIVVSGHSAGGHLSLTTGMLQAAAGLDRRCPANVPAPGRVDTQPKDMPVAAIINWFGITDVADLVEGPNAKSYAVAWVGSNPDWRSVAQRVSPINLLHDKLPPILTIHGDADLIVPYAHATRLHAALDAAGLPNRLITIEQGGHGRFSLAEDQRNMQAIQTFLREHSILQ